MNATYPVRRGSLPTPISPFRIGYKFDALSLGGHGPENPLGPGLAQAEEPGLPADPMDWTIEELTSWGHAAGEFPGREAVEVCALQVGAPEGFFDLLESKTACPADACIPEYVFDLAGVTAEEADHILALQQCFDQVRAPGPGPNSVPEPYPLPPVVTEAQWLVLADQVRSGPARSGLWRTLTDGVNPTVITQICKLQTGQVREGMVTVEQWRAHGPAASCEELFALIDDFMVEYPIAPDPVGTDSPPLTFEEVSALRKQILNIKNGISTLPEESESSAIELLARLSWCVKVVEDAIEAESTIKANTASQCLDAVEATLNRVEGGGTAGPAKPEIPVLGWVAGGAAVLTIAGLIAFK